MKLCNPRTVRYAATAMRTSPPLLMARLRASVRVAAWVLLVFLLKVGMVAACTVDEMQDSTWGVTSTQVPATDAALPSEASEADEPSSLLAHAAGGCEHRVGLAGSGKGAEEDLELAPGVRDGNSGHPQF